MIDLAASLFRYRGLLVTLTGRELKARYRGSVLGYFWSLVNPLLLLSVYTFVFSTIFQPRDANVSPYGLFLATGIFPWLWVSSAWVEGTNSLQANAGLIRKASFPAQLLPIVSVLANLVHFAFTLPIIAAAFLVARRLGFEVGGPSILLMPFIALMLLPAVSGLALGFAALNVLFKDVRDLLSNLLTLLFFMTPILYTLETLEPFPIVRWFVAYNPFTPFFRSFQLAMFHGDVPPPGLWIEMAIVSVVMWAVGAALFKRLSPILVESV